MDLEEFHSQLADAPLSFQRKLQEYFRNPTERNACYITGYVVALEDAHLFKPDIASYWLAVIDRTERNYDAGQELLTETMRNFARTTATGESQMHEEYFVSLATEIYQIPDNSVRQHAARAVARACMRVDPRFNMQSFLTACDAVWPSAPKAMTDCCEKNCEAPE